ncbi:MAG: hypothetical protein Q9201_001473 [Fulgogasparrea decipioides]
MQPTRLVTRCDDGAVLNGLDGLPNEILETVLYNLHDLGDLHTFINTYRRARDIFWANPEKVIKKLLQTSNIGDQIQKLIFTIIFLRRVRNRYWNNLGEVSVGSVLEHLQPDRFRPEKKLVEERTATLVQELGPMKYLSDAAGISKQITEAEDSLIETMLTKTHIRMQEAKIAKQHPCDERQRLLAKKVLTKLRTRIKNAQHARQEPLCESQDASSPHTTHGCPVTMQERHRIRRAFYRLSLYFELFHHREQSTVDQVAFFNPLTIWEIEEMECAYFHLRWLWCIRGPWCRSPMLPDVETEHTTTCGRFPFDDIHRQQPGNTDNQGPLIRTFEDACAYYRKEKWQWERSFNEPKPDLVATLSSPNGDEASAGWMFLNARSKVRTICPRVWVERKRSLGCSLDSDYCMWDPKRLQAWRLIDDPEEGIRAEMEWWRDGSNREDRCADCHHELSCLWPDLEALFNA